MLVHQAATSLATATLASFLLHKMNEVGNLENLENAMQPVSGSNGRSLRTSSENPVEPQTLQLSRATGFLLFPVRLKRIPVIPARLAMSETFAF